MLLSSNSYQLFLFILQTAIHSLEEENTFLRDELDDLKRRIYEYEQQ